MKRPGRRRVIDGAIWSGRFTAVMFSIFKTLELWKIDCRLWLVDYLEAFAQRGGKPLEDITPHLPWHIKDKSEEGKVYCGRAFSKF